MVQYVQLVRQTTMVVHLMGPGDESTSKYNTAYSYRRVLTPYKTGGVITPLRNYPCPTGVWSMLHPDTCWLCWLFDGRKIWHKSAPGIMRYVAQG
jgi:hypothetical protein